jgi:hypothetical protein
VERLRAEQFLAPNLIFWLACELAKKKPGGFGVKKKIEKTVFVPLMFKTCFFDFFFLPSPNPTEITFSSGFFFQNSLRTQFSPGRPFSAILGEKKI